MNESKPVALITGGGTGIGAAAARRMAKDGYRICVTGRRPEPLRDVATEVGGMWVSADMLDDDAPSRIVDECLQEYGRLDAVVVNAALSTPGSPIDIGRDTWNAVIGTNLTGAFFVCQSALPHLIDSKGALVTVGSISSYRASPESVAYCAAKAGMKIMTECIALEYGYTGMRANHVCPGWTSTDMANRSMDRLGARYGVDRSGAYDIATAAVPARRPGTPEELAEVIAWMASPAASYVNGATLIVDGGGSVVDPHLLAFGDANSPRHPLARFE